MAHVIAVRDPTPASLGEVIDALSSWGFDPADEVSVSHAANWLRRLSNDGDFLGDLMIDRLAGRAEEGAERVAGIGANAVILAPPVQRDFYILAQIWPAEGDHAYRASGPSAFEYGIAHDHNFDFLTVGYFGPGIVVDDYEYDASAIAGRVGEQVDMRFLGRSRVTPGHVVQYRANRDIHCVFAPAALSVTLALVHVHAVQAWTNHYVFQPHRNGPNRSNRATISRVLGSGPSEAFLRIAVAMGGDEALDLAERFARHHPSERMRQDAWRALAAAAPDEAARAAIREQAGLSGAELITPITRARESGPQAATPRDSRTG